MPSISSIAVSGLNAAQRRLEATANNVANSSTPDFKRQEVVSSSRPEGGVTTEVRRTEGGENLTEDVVEQVEARIAFQANLRALEAERRTVGSLLDVTA